VFCAGLAVAAFGTEVNMAAIIWAWILFIALSALFAGSLWVTIIAEFLKEHGPKLARASIRQPSPSQPQMTIFAPDAEPRHHWQASAKGLTVASTTAGVRRCETGDRLAPCRVSRVDRLEGGPDEERRPISRAAIHPGERGRSTRPRAASAERQCQSQFANPAKP
jgi:hypothetical protein